MKRFAAPVLAPALVYVWACSSSNPDKTEGMCEGGGPCTDGPAETATVGADARGDGPLACASPFDCTFPFFSPPADQNTVPCCADGVCKLETFDENCADGAAQIIQASNYDQSCMMDSDCVWVAEGNLCYPGATNCANAAINKSATAQYQAVVSRTRAASCYAPGNCGASFGPCCVAGRCQVGSECGNLGSDASADASADASTDAASECGGKSITLDLMVAATGPVYYGGPQALGWLDSFGCPSWLTVAPAGGPPLNLAKGGCAVSCPASRPEPSIDQSFTWDGTYYPSDAGACQTPACAAPGNYIATICVGYAAEDGGGETAPPTCKRVPFAWPTTSANQPIVESIAPTADGG